MFCPQGGYESYWLLMIKLNVNDTINRKEMIRVVGRLVPSQLDLQPLKRITYSIAPENARWTFEKFVLEARMAHSRPSLAWFAWFCCGCCGIQNGCASGDFLHSPDLADLAWFSAAANPVPST